MTCCKNYNINEMINKMDHKSTEMKMLCYSVTLYCRYDFAKEITRSRKPLVR